MRYMRFLATKQELPAALPCGDPAFAALPDYFRSRFEPALSKLQQAASDAGTVCADIAPYDLLRAIGNLAVASGDDGSTHTERMLKLLLDGLYFGAAKRKQACLRSGITGHEPAGASHGQRCRDFRSSVSLCSADPRGLGLGKQALQRPDR